MLMDLVVAVKESRFFSENICIFIKCLYYVVKIQLLFCFDYHASSNFPEVVFYFSKTYCLIVLCISLPSFFITYLYC